MLRLTFLLLALVAANAWSDDTSNTAEAIFAGGCFWCMEPPYDEMEGVLDTTSGYIGGHVSDPSYEQVVTGTTGHAEVVRVTYDPERVRYADLLKVFWRNIDPLDGEGQFCDRGSPYRPGIFYLDEDQRALAERTKRKVGEHFDRDIPVEVTEASTFYEAEDYHQNYYQKNPIRYRFYRNRCGRDQRLEALWGRN